MEAIDKLEVKLDKVADDCNKLWTEHRMCKMRGGQHGEVLESLVSDLTDMKDQEVSKAVERQKMQDSLDSITKSIDRLAKSTDEKFDGFRDDFQDHAIEEMKEYSKMRKVVTIMGVVIIALVIDSEADTHIISGLWKWALNSVVGI